MIIAFNEKKIDLHAIINCKVKDVENGEPVEKIVETTTGRVIINQVVPEEIGYLNQLMTKKALRDIIGDVLKLTGTAKTSQFLDDIKNLGFTMAFEGGLSFNLGDIVVPEIKEELIRSSKWRG